VGLALAVGWAGYTLAYFGVCSLKGAGVGLLDLVIPGRTVVIPGGSSGPAPGSAGAGGITIGGTGGAGQGAGGSTITTDPNGNVTNIVPGPGINSPQPGGTFT
jgi:hypothetical protein